jgi:hypothetical protein
MNVINFEKSKCKKESNNSFYNIYKVDCKSSLYNTLNLYLSKTKYSDRIDMCEFEKALGIVEFCLDLDMYHKKDCYYIVLVLTDVKKFNEIKSNEFKEISIQQFKNEVGNNYTRIKGLGTGNLLDRMCLV